MKIEYYLHVKFWSFKVAKVNGSMNLNTPFEIITRRLVANFIKNQIEKHKKYIVEAEIYIDGRKIELEI